MRCSPRALAQHRTRRAIVLHTRMYLITPDHTMHAASLETGTRICMLSLVSVSCPLACWLRCLAALET